MGLSYRSLALGAALCALILCVSSVAQAQPQLRAFLHTYGAVALSPSADRIALSENGFPTLQIRSAHDGALLQSLNPCPGCIYSAATWSPDGRALAFLAANHGAVSVYVAADGAEPVAVVTLSNDLVACLRWSPDGQRLAFLLVEAAKKQTGATQPGVPLVGEIGDTPDSQRIAYVSRTGGPLKLASPLGTFVYEFDWRGDGNGFVATEAKGDGDANWWVAKLADYDLDGAERIIAGPAMQMNRPTSSPDGRTVAVIGGLMSDFGPVGGDVFLTPTAGGAPRNLTPGFKGSVKELFWRGSHLMGQALIGDRASLIEISQTGGAPKVLWSEPVGLTASLSADGAHVALITQDWERAPQILAGPISAPVKISHDNDAAPPHVRAQSVTWKSDGFNVQGWLLSPVNPAPGKHPMVVDIHGGPSSAVTPSYVYDEGDLELIDRGYYLFYPNPRGSYGQGEAFTRANYKDFGGGDLRDIMAGIDAVERIAPVDDKKLAITGGSYGGFMVMWAVAHTNRFAAAVAGAGISDWFSYYGENGINTWMPPFFGGAAYDDPALYLKLSPISTIKKARTPTFIWVGERDIECPPSQSIEFWNGMKAAGAPVSLVIYPGEGHGIRQPANVIDLNRRTLALFDQYLGGSI